jgi:Signal transduction histidine kinase
VKNGLLRRFRHVFEPDPLENNHIHLNYSSEQLRKKVEFRQLAILKHRTTAVVAIRMLLILIFSGVCWKYVGGWVMGLWLGFALMHTLASMKSADDFFNEIEPEKKFRYWRNRSLQMIIVSGLSVGFAGFYFMIPDNVIVEMVLLALVVGVTFGSIPLYAIWPPALWAYVPCTLLPTFVKLFIIYETPWFVAVFWSAVLLLIIFYFGARLNSIYTQGIYRAFEREYLMEQLIYQRQRADYVREAAEMEINSRTKFFAGANHDLRQPLQAMGIFISVLESQADDQTRPIVEGLSKACHSVSTLVDQILMISKLDSKTIKINPIRFSLQELFAELEAEFEPQCRNKGLSLEVQSVPADIVTDEQLLERVIRNLLGNAVRYTSSGMILLRSKISRKNTLIITVSDTGCGISSEEREKLFQAYYRGAGGFKAKEGFGLGLSVVKKICELLSIDIKVISKVGKGSIFRLELPLRAQTSKESSPAKPQTLNLRPLDGTRILVIEDDRLIRESLKTLLEGWGCVVRTAEFYDAELAAKLVHESPIDLIFSDFNLGPEHMTGLQSIFRIRSALGRRIPAIVSTAAPRDAVISQYEEETEGLNFSDSAVDLMEMPLLLQKPISPHEINRAIHRLLDKK